MDTALTPEAFAWLIDGREYPFELSSEERQLARANGLLVVFGCSDDLCEFDGMFRDEAGCYNGGKVQFSRNEVVELEPENLEFLKRYKLTELVMSQFGSVKAVWQGKTTSGDEVGWCYDVGFPTARFIIKEDEDLYCEGLVFRLEDAFTNGGRG